MSSFNFNDEMRELQTKILNLEKLENNKKELLDHNFKVINDVLIEKKAAIINNRYSKSEPLARYYDQELVTHLDAIYNILHIFNNRLDKLEESS